MLCKFYRKKLYTYCKKFRKNRQNRKAISVRAVWLSSRTEVYQLGREIKPGFETRNALTLRSVVINCLHCTNSYRGCVPKFTVSIEGL